MTRIHAAYLSLGSNIDPARNLRAAVTRLAREGEMLRVSNVWQSAPYGYSDQPDFLNAAVLLRTPLSAEDIVSEVIPQIENELNRERDPRNKNGPRTIDIDLSLFDHATLTVLSKAIPDPAILERLFVAQPLAELQPDYCHPLSGETLATIVERLKQTSAPLTRRQDVVISANPRVAQIGH